MGAREPPQLSPRCAAGYIHVPGQQSSEQFYPSGSRQMIGNFWYVGTRNRILKVAHPIDRDAGESQRLARISHRAAWRACKFKSDHHFRFKPWEHTVSRQAYRGPGRL
jgi:hypothetical protein